MSEELPVGDKMYFSSKRASEISNYAQDYIGQLARSGQIDAVRVGGLWYVDMESLDAYRTKSIDEERVTIRPRVRNTDTGNDTTISFDGKIYISANRASKVTGYNQDYIGQLARSEKIASRQVGNRWYVNQQELIRHKEEKDSLLAAVQARAVGIYPPRPSNEDLHQATTDQGLELLRYIPDERDLNPLIEDKKSLYKGNYQDSPPMPQLTPEENRVPIHVVRPVSERANIKRRARHSIIDQKKNPTALKTLIYGLFFAFAVLMLAVSIKAGLSGQLSMKMTELLSSNPLSGLNMIATDFEQLVSPELTYQRTD